MGFNPVFAHYKVIYIVFKRRKAYISDMKNSSLGTAALIALSFSLALAACSPNVVTRGNLVSPAQFQDVKPKISKRADVVKAWGPPTTVSTFNPNIWYYIGETTSQKGIYAPEVKKRRLIRITFDSKDNDTVADITDLDPKQGKDVDLVSRKTPNAGKEFTAVQQFIGNLGKYNSNPDKK
jgi:outer membrane protein assembly factor BamE (lipoprotein component of BamABCDE complex)